MLARDQRGGRKLSQSFTNDCRTRPHEILPAEVNRVAHCGFCRALLGRSTPEEHGEEGALGKRPFGVTGQTPGGDVRARRVGVYLRLCCRKWFKLK